ncbi:hypothetical protein BCT94_10595 [Vibrio breoganii]|uniref:glycosyltransferase family 4 protein n=1 Tax=Vibrio breoganii TaxID=553239 RepID=UPI000C834C8E|nr:glycosyltransferase family 4 protein [Vibrio breoganii]PMK74230.1 hypothetical protein BCT94_10595 [Vibrio breoganii]
MKNKIKIAHLQLLPLITGVQRVSLDELERLKKEKFESYIISKEQGPMTIEAESKGINCLYCNNLVREISPIKDLIALWELYRLFREKRFDVVHTHSSKTGVIGRVAAKLAGVPMVVHTVHGFAFPAAKNRLERRLFHLMEWLGTKCSDKVICLHEADRKIARDSLGAKDSQLIVLANGVDIEKYSPLNKEQQVAIRKTLGLEQTDVVIGMVGRLWRQKNPTAFIDAAIHLLHKGVEANFILVGDGELKTSLENQVVKAGFKDSIHFLGWRRDIPSILSALDIFVLPSLWEGMPLAIIEAQSSGLPCVVSNIQGNNHLVKESIDGLLFDLNYPEQLAKKIEYLIEHKKERLEFANNARSNVVKYNNINNRVEVISNLYLSKLSTKNTL